MVSKKSGLVLSVIGLVVFVFSLVYVSSCTKPLADYRYSCINVVCQNGGHCDSGRCTCPVGYEGGHCETRVVDHFYGTWKVHQRTVGSDSTNVVGKDSVYNLELMPTATPTTFFIYNFAGNQYYSELVCLLDSTFNNNFTIDTTSALNMAYDHYRIRGGYGKRYATDSIWARVYVRRLNYNVNWQRDTMELELYRLK